MTRTLPQGLSKKQKAAVIVQLLLSEGTDLTLEALPDGMQADLARQLAGMRAVDRGTLASVALEFATELDQIGMVAAGGVDGALALLDGKIGDRAVKAIREDSAVPASDDPWDRIKAADNSVLLPMLAAESVEVAAVALSKLPVPKAADLLGAMPGDQARRVSYAISLTEAVTARAVEQIGAALVIQLDDKPIRVFVDAPFRRVGAILNFSPAATRDDVLEGLNAEDAGFAADVRKAIFTFSDIPDRLAPLDVPKVTRDVDAEILIRALAYAAATGTEAAVEFILANMSKRMAEGLREEMEEAGTIKPKDGEAAMTVVTSAIRTLADNGTITLIVEDDEDDS